MLHRDCWIMCDYLIPGTPPLGCFEMIDCSVVLADNPESASHWPPGWKFLSGVWRCPKHADIDDGKLRGVDVAIFDPPVQQISAAVSEPTPVALAGAEAGDGIDED